MSPKPIFLIAGILSGLVLAGPLGAADSAGSAENQLRDALRNAMIRLGAAESDRAALQASQAESDQRNKELTSQVETLTKRSAADKAAADKAVAGLNARISEQAAEIAQLKENLEKWKAAYAQTDTAGRSAEARRVKLEAETIALQRRVADLETRNAALFKLGNEILTRYADFSLGNALRAKEPFVGITRVKLENLVQGYQDKLADQKSNP